MSNQNIHYSYTGDVDSLRQATQDALGLFDSYNKKLYTTGNSIGKLGRQVTNLGNTLSKPFEDLTKTIQSTAKVLAGVTGVALGASFAEGSKSAIDFVENLNLFKVAMRESLEEGQKFIAMMADLYGLDPSYLSRATGLFYSMGAAVSVPADAAKKMSLDLTALAVDLGSLFNVDFDTVSDNLVSGMRGMSRAVLKYGMDLRATTVETYANSKGITAQYETMNEASREILRYVVMIDQASRANSDFMRTIESPANQLRIFKEQIVQLGRAIGNFLIAPMAAALPYINGFVMALQMVLQAIAELLGLMKWVANSTTDFGESASDSTDDVSNGLGGIGGAADDAAKKMKNLLAPFDELNILAEDAADSSAGGVGGIGDFEVVDPAILKLLEETEYKMEQVRMKALEVRDAILEFLGIKVWTEFDEETGRMIYKLEFMADVLEENLVNKFPQWEKTIRSFFDNFSANVAAIQRFLDALKVTLGTVAKAIGDWIMQLLGIEDADEAFANFFANFSTNLDAVTDWLLNNQDTVYEITQKFMDFALALGVVSTAAKILGPILMGLGSGVIVLGAVSSGVSSVATGLSKLGGVFSALKNTVVAALGGISATVLAVVAVVLSAIIAVWQRSEEFRNNFSVMIQSIVTLLSQFAETFQALFTLVGEFLAMWWDSTSIVLNGAFEWLLNTIVNIVTAITDALTGLLTFLEGIFTGDLDKAMEGIKMVIQSVIYAIVTLVVGALNGLISVVFLAINGIGNTVYTFLCGVVRMVNLVGGLIGVHLEYPDKSLFVIEDVPQIPMPPLEFANGGVVTGPTYAMIGEGLYNEAVIPLGNSPQMQELLEQFASIVTNRGFVEPVEVRVFIGDKEWDAFTYESAERGKELVGATPIKERS